MSASLATEMPTNVEEMNELHDMAAHAVELLKAMANEWRLMILSVIRRRENRQRAPGDPGLEPVSVVTASRGASA